MTQHRRARGGAVTARRFAPTGAILAFLTTTALVLGTTAGPAAGDETDAVAVTDTVAPEITETDGPVEAELDDTIDEVDVALTESDSEGEAVDLVLPEVEIDPELESLVDLEGQTVLEFGPGLLADSGAFETPYVQWSAVDGNDVPLGGATFQLQGPRTGGRIGSWNDQVLVVDWQGEDGYQGDDLDPAPGMFKVNAIGTHEIAETNRYRVQQMAAPDGYFFDDADWTEIPAARNSYTNPSGWTLGVYDFGAFENNEYAGLVCAPGHFYSVTSNGTLQQVVNDGSAPASVGRWTGMGSNNSANGVAISQYGDVAYAFERNSDADEVSRILRYTAATGQFERIPNSAFNPRVTGLALVAGAVNPVTGNYLFGGFASSGGNRYFYIYEYNPNSNSTSYLGRFQDSSTSGSANGDMAFDSQGNLFVVRSGSSTNIFTVTAASLTAAPGANTPLISRTSLAESSSVSLGNVNGIAFDADGYIYLGNSTTAHRYDPATWEKQGGDVTTRLGSSTDLASCTSPATLTVKKNIVDRVNDSDQFKLSVLAGGEERATAETTGTETGIQEEQIGPMAVVSGQTYTISETFTQGAEAEDYASAFVCERDGVPIAQESGTSGEVTIPYGMTSSGAAVECVFTNSPLLATVTVTKYVVDENLENKTATPDWTVGAVVTEAHVGAATAEPTAETQKTDDEGTASWSVRFDKTAARADITVSETQQPGYQFESGLCEVIPLNGETQSFELSSEEGFTLEKIAPGSAVECEYINRKNPTTLTLIKEIEGHDDVPGDNFDPDANVDQWTLTAEREEELISGITNDPAVTNAAVEPGEYVLAEALMGEHSAKATGYQLESLKCVDTSKEDNPQDLDVELSGDPGIGRTGTLVIDDGANVECTFLNSTLPGSIAWDKVTEGDDPLPLKDSIWKLEGPGTGDLREGITGSDTGNFLLENLVWGTYTLTEQEAPAGFEWDEEVGPPTFQVTLTPPDLKWEATSEGNGPITNDQVRPVTLPIAGGSGTWMYIGGGMLLLLVGAGGWLLVTRRQQSIQIVSGDN